MGCNDIRVVHLVRACNGIEPLKRFFNVNKIYPTDVKYDFFLPLKSLERVDFFMDTLSGVSSVIIARLTKPAKVGNCSAGCW
jgi:hypothetical protein